MCLDCNDPIQVPIVTTTVTNGQNGQSVYAYYASADDTFGTGFSYPAVSTQVYRALLITTTPINNPQVSDFTGLWYQAIGTDGVNGTNGTNGTNGIFGGISFEYNFLGFNLSGTNPGVGNLMLNGSTTNLTSTLTINYTDFNSVNLSNLLAFLNSSTNNPKSLVKIVKKDDSSKYAVYSVSTALSAVGYAAISVTHLASSATTFSAGDQVIFTFAPFGDRGPQGNPGPAGSFIIGTLGSGNIAYPAAATQGSAYRFTGNGTISDSGAGLANVKRFFTNDVLYCIADSTVSDGTKWFIWTGFPRPFKPGAGTDSFVHNTASPGTAAGTSSIALNDNSAASGNTSIAGIGGSASGSRSVALGASSQASGADGVAIGPGNIASGAQSTALGYLTTAAAIGSVALGQQSNINAAATAAVSAGYLGQIGASAAYSFASGKIPQARFHAESVFGHGSWDVNKYGQAQTSIVGVGRVVTDGGVPATNQLTTDLAGGGQLTIPQDSVWVFEGQVVVSKTSTDEVAVWIFKGVVKNASGTAAIVGDVLYLDPATGTYINSSTQFAQDAALSAATLAISTIGANLLINATGLASTTLRWYGSLKITQLGWF